MDSLESIGRHIIHLSGQLNFLERRWLALIAEFDRRRGWAGQVERIVRYYRRAQECEELSREQRQQWHRSLCHEYLDDGSILIKARLPAETGRLVLNAVEAALEHLPDTAPAELKIADGSPHPSARRADALGLVAEGFLAAGPTSQSGAERQQIVVHVDAQVQRERCAGHCEFEQGPSIAAETARRLACDASVVEISHDEKGNVLDIGRKSRSIPPAIRRALKACDRGCRFPGCHHDRYVDGHHIRHWADGGETRLGNLVTLCRYHHRVVHEEGMSIQVLDDGALRFCRADGLELPRHPPMLGPVITPVVDAEAEGIDPRAALARTLADTRMDYGLAVSALLSRRSWDVSAETSRADI